MNYIKLTTNLPNPTNIYHVATYKIRQIRTISVGKKYIRVWIILYWPLISRIKRIYTMSRPKKIRSIRPIRVQKNIRVWIILTWLLISRII